MLQSATLKAFQTCLQTLPLWKSDISDIRLHGTYPKTPQNGESLSPSKFFAESGESGEVFIGLATKAIAWRDATVFRTASFLVLKFLMYISMISMILHDYSLIIGDYWW